MALSWRHRENHPEPSTPVGRRIERYCEAIVQPSCDTTVHIAHLERLSDTRAFEAGEGGAADGHINDIGLNYNAIAQPDLGAAAAGFARRSPVFIQSETLHIETPGNGVRQPVTLSL